MSQIRTWKHSLLLGISILSWAFSPAVSSAQTPPCGNIITFEKITPIEDCANPFGVSSDPTPYTLTVDGVEVQDGNVVLISKEGTANYFVIKEGESYNIQNNFYKHDNGDLKLVDTGYIQITEVDVRQFAQSFFSEGVDTETYVQHYLDSSIMVDEDVFDYELFFEFSNYVDNNFVYTQSPLMPGTYTLVSQEIYVYVTQQSLFERIKNFFIKTAHAQSYPTAPKFTITFTLASESTKPSSILFLPGIQGSRLYTEGIQGTEDQLWEPNINGDLKQLEMNKDGFSINEEIYTRDVIDEVNVSPIFQGNIYKGFLGMLEDLKEDEVISDFTAFAYDWRYNIKDIVYSGTKYENEIHSLVDEVESLAEDSFSGKVTIVGHSNGGLLAKVLISELDRLGKSNLVDKIVLVGTPQLGSPKAIGVMLHGLDMHKGAGLVIDSSTAREVIKNMPGAYNLLPSQKYFEESGDVVVFADDSSAAADILAYGDINSLTKLKDFVLDNQDLRSDISLINEPSVLNNTLMQNMIDERSGLDSWQSPDDVEVYEVAGTGILTIKGFQYRTFPCAVAICYSQSYVKPFPIFTKAGDETVPLISAKGYSGNKTTGVIDLVREGAQFSVLTRDHADLTESPTVQKFIDSIIRYRYQNEILEIPEDFIDVTKYIIIGVHSPVNITLIDSGERRVGIFEGRLLEEIDGSQYFELGGSKYLIIPEENEYTVNLEGVEDGVYSVTIDLLDEEDNQQNLLSFMGANSGPEMLASFNFDGENFSNIESDVDGDGDLDVKYNWDGTSEVVTGDIIEKNTSSSKSNRTLLKPTTQSLVVSTVSNTELDSKLMQIYLLLKELSVLLDRWGKLQVK